MGALEVMLWLNDVLWCRWAGREGGRLDESERARPRLVLLLSFLVVAGLNAAILCKTN